MGKQLVNFITILFCCHLGGVMVIMLVSIVVDLELDPGSGQIKDYKISAYPHKK
jgi:hypothetical protein